MERTNTQQKELIRRLEMELDDAKTRLDHSQHRETDLENMNKLEQEVVLLFLKTVISLPTIM